MKLLITGANGFVGRNLRATLGTMEGMEVLPFDVDTDPGLLVKYAAECDVVAHLAGVNRPEKEEEFMTGNFGFTSTLLDALKAVAIPAVEVHLTDVQSREEFRRISYPGMACLKTFAGFGFDGYRLAVDYLMSYLKEEEKKKEEFV